MKPSNELDGLKMSSAYIEEENNTLNKDEVDYKLHNIWYYPTSASSRTCKGVVLSGWVAGLMKLLEKQWKFTENVSNTFTFFSDLKKYNITIINYFIFPSYPRSWWCLWNDCCLQKNRWEIITFISGWNWKTTDTNKCQQWKPKLQH